MTYFVLIK
ncbi:hypothetical protein D030_3895A, partial [Vibrio parahaemolyticus AQ3810]